MPDLKNPLEKISQEQLKNLNTSSEQKRGETIPVKEKNQEIQNNQIQTQQDPPSSINQQIQVKHNAQASSVGQDELAKEIENILESGLENLYMKMPKEKQLQFRQKGEEVSNKIAIILKEVKIKTSKILSLIMSWLSIIPGVNKFFIRQESKIKTDKIIALKNKNPRL